MKVVEKIAILTSFYIFALLLNANSLSKVIAFLSIIYGMSVFLIVLPKE